MLDVELRDWPTKASIADRLSGVRALPIALLGQTDFENVALLAASSSHADFSVILPLRVAGSSRFPRFCFVYLSRCLSRTFQVACNSTRISVACRTGGSGR